ncbi:recombinase family protein [Kitasatospora sp. NPDC086791]|uniref:recombinase family protein n=1 Tax=Kitasatospora sp. NPDC086791 TaxID=3155178 RepID=UPI0034447738
MATSNALIPPQQGRGNEELIPAIGYIRVSLAREEMISPELQRKAIEEWAARTGHKTIDWVEDLDKTGRNFKRRIMRVIERIEAGEAQVIAVWKYSRFGRSRSGCILNIDRLEAAGGQLVSATENFDTTTAEGRLQRGVMMEFNAYESERAGTQWRETHAWRRNQGLPATGGQRLGYIWHPRKTYRPDGSVKLQDERYELDPRTAPLVADLYQRYIDGEGFLQLCETLNRAGIRTVRGNPWSTASIKFYLDTGFAAGYLRIHDPECRVPYDDKCPRHILVRHPTMQHPAIISEETWELYRQRRKQVAVTPPRARAAVHPLSGLVRCGICSGSTTRSRGGRRGFVSHQCGTRHRQGLAVCKGITMSEKALLTAVKSWLQDLLDEVEASASQAADAAKERELRRLSVASDPKADLEARISKIDRAIARQMQLFAMLDDDDHDGTLASAHQKTLLALRDEKAEARGKLEAVEAGGRSGSGPISQASAAAVAEGLLEEWLTIPPQRMNALLRRVIGQIVVTGERQIVIVEAW